MAKIKFIGRQSFESKIDGNEKEVIKHAKNLCGDLSGIVGQSLDFPNSDNKEVYFEFAVVDLEQMNLKEYFKEKMQKRFYALFDDDNNLDRPKIKKLCEKYEELLQDFLFVTELNAQINMRYEDVIKVVPNPAEIEEIKAGIVTKEIENKLNLLWKVAHAYEKGTNQEIKELDKKPQIKKE